MLRWIATILSFALVVGSMDAALHFDALLGSGGPHELHGQLHDPGEGASAVGNPDQAPAPDDGDAAHFCHCGVHSPAMLASFAMPRVPVTQYVVPGVHGVHGDGVYSLPLRPPNRA